MASSVHTGTVTKGRTMVTGESVTPAKMNDIVENATCQITDGNDIDNATQLGSSGKGYPFYQKSSNNLEFREILGGTNLTVAADSTTAITINNDLTATNGIWSDTGILEGRYIDVGTLRIGYFYTNAVAGNIDRYETATLTALGLSSVLNVIASTEVASNSGNTEGSWQAVAGYTKDTLDLRFQQVGSSTDLTRAHVMVLGVRA